VSAQIFSTREVSGGIGDFSIKVTQDLDVCTLFFNEGLDGCSRQRWR
jgi:hypothetical protein